MARICDICAKGTVAGNTRSHSMQAVKRRYKPNLQFKKIKLDDGIVVKVRLCTKCYKTYRMQLA